MSKGRRIRLGSNHAIINPNLFEVFYEISKS